MDKNDEPMQLSDDKKCYICAETLQLGNSIKRCFFVYEEKSNNAKEIAVCDQCDEIFKVQAANRKKYRLINLHKKPRFT